MKNYLKYLWCKIRRHKPRKEEFWDMVGNPQTDWWHIYTCPKCGTWQ